VHSNYENFKATKEANQAGESTKEEPNYSRESDGVEWGSEIEIVERNSTGINYYDQTYYSE